MNRLKSILLMGVSKGAMAVAVTTYVEQRKHEIKEHYSKTKSYSEHREDVLIATGFSDIN